MSQTMHKHALLEKNRVENRIGLYYLGDLVGKLDFCFF